MVNLKIMKMKVSNCSLLFSAVVLILLYAPPVSAKRFIVGGRNGWTAGNNFTYWAHQQAPFHVGDILVFFRDEDIGDVLLVDKTAFEKCDCTQPFSSHGEGIKYEFQLNRAGDYYFINSYYCDKVQMKLAIRAEPSIGWTSSSQALPPSPSPRRLVVGGRHGWTSGNNFTYWAHQHKPFHVGDLLVFFREEELGNVLLVDKIAFEKCDSSQPFSRHGEGTKYDFQLNQTGDYYLINSYDCEEHQMKLAIRVESLLAPHVLPSSRAIPSSPSSIYQPSSHHV